MRANLSVEKRRERISCAELSRFRKPASNVNLLTSSSEAQRRRREADEETNSAFIRHKVVSVIPPESPDRANSDSHIPIKEHDLISDRQYGFHYGRSTGDLIVYLTRVGFIESSVSLDIEKNCLEDRPNDCGMNSRCFPS
ncbi:unnamed protein product [Euphydryas editha]|uniref:Uncharacterized protein n=1 Tax=Euphydryas editha TaxID=104508 RepID=A0AAU9UY24_EUPED|nr:unnamed protein product [Euphydryas editha]